MFPLHTNTFPTTAGELERLLNESLRQLFNLGRDPVELRGESYPQLDSLRVSLSGAQVRDRPPAMPAVSGTPEPALTIESFKVDASPLLVGPAPVDFALSASRVALHRATDRAGQLLLLLQSAAEGRVEISIAVSDLEALIAQVAKTEAARHGVSIDRVELLLRSRSGRSLAAEVRLRAKKLFVSASLRITGQLDVDEKLTARVSGLDCIGEGAIAGIACGVLKPHLEKLNGREFPLMSLPLGDVRLRDVQIETGEKLFVTAEFGSARE